MNLLINKTNRLAINSHDVAEKMAQIYNAILLLGSATPSLESFYKAQNGEYTLLTMKERIDNIPMPFIEGVDMREELKHGNRKILSRKLKELISTTLAKKTTIDYHAEQAWIFYFL